MRIVFELEEVPGGILQKECVVLNPGSGEPHARLLVKRQPLGLCLIGQGLPRFLRRQDQSEMTRIDSLLRRYRFWRQMGHELMPCEPERDCMARLPTQGTTKSIDVETFRRRHVVYGKR